MLGLLLVHMALGFQIVVRFERDLRSHFQAEIDGLNLLEKWWVADQSSTRIQRIMKTLVDDEFACSIDIRVRCMEILPE